MVLEDEADFAVPESLLALAHPEGILPAERNGP